MKIAKELPTFMFIVIIIFSTHAFGVTAYEVQTIDGEKVVVDHNSGLMWQQSGAPKPISWERAKDYVNQLNKELFGGYSDWRLPTLEELKGLLKPTKENNNLYINPVFDITQFACWSSDQGKDLHSAWFVDFKDKNEGTLASYKYLYVRAVRSISKKVSAQADNMKDQKVRLAPIKVPEKPKSSRAVFRTTTSNSLTRNLNMWSLLVILGGLLVIFIAIGILMKNSIKKEKRKLISENQKSIESGTQKSIAICKKCGERKIGSLCEFWLGKLTGSQTGGTSVEGAELKTEIIKTYSIVGHERWFICDDCAKEKMKEELRKRFKFAIVVMSVSVILGGVSLLFLMFNRYITVIIIRYIDNFLKYLKYIDDFTGVAILIVLISPFVIPISLFSTLKYLSLSRLDFTNVEINEVVAHENRQAICEDLAKQSYKNLTYFTPSQYVKLQKT